MTTVLRFGVLVLQDAPFPTLVERWRRVEELGFDQLFVADHTGDYRDTPGGPWFDGWTVLAAMAAHTTGIRIGTLVSNPVLRPPAVLAKAAVTVDHLSDGRLELGIGTGIAPFDHAATGTEPWSAGERFGRFAEYVEVVDGLLRGAGRSYSFDGRWYRSREASTVPGPVQRPRPPIIVAGQSPTVLRVAAERADVWNTHGPFGAGLDEIVKITRSQTHQLDELCAAAGRDPASLRRSLLLFAALDPWTSDVEPAAVIERFAEQAQVAEFVVFWPGDDRVGDLERGQRDPRLNLAQGSALMVVRLTAHPCGPGPRRATSARWSPLGLCVDERGGRFPDTPQRWWRNKALALVRKFWIRP